LKRIEMVDIMAQAYRLSLRGGISEMSDEERMEYVLTAMEDAGILPPPIDLGDAEWE
jgi:hypothetical protein